jgi:hypothetical protein
MTLKLTFLPCVLLVLCLGCVLAANKVNVCHNLGNGGYNLLSVSSSAVLAHLNHGDNLPWTCDADRSWSGTCSNNLGGAYIRVL